jgi:hypothetical protein
MDKNDLERLIVAYNRAALKELNGILKDEPKYLSPEMFADAIACRDELQAQVDARLFAAIHSLFPDLNISDVQIPRFVLLLF